jgi:hypothetical protein
MSETLLRLMEAHGVQCDIDEDGIWALDEIVTHGVDHSEWINVAGWTKAQVLTWLGY